MSLALARGLTLARKQALICNNKKVIRSDKINNNFTFSKNKTISTMKAGDIRVGPVGEVDSNNQPWSSVFIIDRRRDNGLNWKIPV